MKFIHFYVIFSVLYFATLTNSYADDKYKASPQVINNYSTCDPVANAGNEIHFDSGTDDLQMGAGYATCGGLNGAKLSIGKRVCNDCPLINFSLGKQEGGDTTVGVGTTWKIKWD